MKMWRKFYREKYKEHKSKKQILQASRFKIYIHNA